MGSGSKTIRIGKTTYRLTPVRKKKKVRPGFGISEITI